MRSQDWLKRHKKWATSEFKLYPNHNFANEKSTGISKMWQSLENLTFQELQVPCLALIYCKLFKWYIWNGIYKLLECAWPFCGLKWFICCCETGVSLLQTVYPSSKSFFWGCLSLCVCLSVAASSFRGKFDFSLKDVYH